MNMLGTSLQRFFGIVVVAWIPRVSQAEKGEDRRRSF